MPPKLEIKDRTLYDLTTAITRTVKTAETPEQVDAEWQQLYGPARDALSLIHWRLLIAEKQDEPAQAKPWDNPDLS
jgi:hypothetical protein